jgi:hypothetical protein
LCFLTGAEAGRTEYGEMPPLRPTGAGALDAVPGVTPPVLVETEPPPEGGATPPEAADALAVPQASATNSTTMANVERSV